MTELGRALRQLRDQVSPDTVGVPSNGRRRATGLRREEVAQLAGISVDYITRLEQGRALHPSAQIIEALARALRLSDAGRTHLFQLAGLAPPGAGLMSSFITPGVQRMLDRLVDTPVAVFDPSWTQLLANPLYTALMGEWHGRDLNAVWRNFLGNGTRVRHTSESLSTLRSGQVGDLHRTAARYPGDERLRRLISDLRRQSSLFDELWTTTPVGQQHETARKVVDHPHVGVITLDCDVLAVAGSDLRIMVYTVEPGSEDADRLSLLSVIGTQSLAG
jgi:transcriptional regulator with XRE-family HTH domain